MSIYGPISDEAQQENQNVDLSLYAKKSNVLLKTGGLMHGHIDMLEHKVVNLGTPRNRQDASTMGYVSDYVSDLNNRKVNWTGGTMAGIIDMGNNKITNIADPENEKDAVNKKYIDELVDHAHDLGVYVVGRYLVFPEEDGDKMYVSLRTKKNIDLQSNLSIQIHGELVFHGFGQIFSVSSANSQDFNYDPQPNGSILLNSALKLTSILGFISAPWTLLFSVRPENPPKVNNSSLISFSGARNVFTYLSMKWELNVFKYIITNDIGAIPNLPIKLDTTQFNHIALEYDGNKLTVWANGKSRKMHTVDLGDISDIRIDVKELGNITYYSRELNKFEIAEHFVEYQVKRYTNDEVLI